MKLLSQEKQDELDNQFKTALLAHDWAAVKSLAKEGANVNQTDSFHRTALMLASEFADVETISFLLKEGADICMTDFESKSPVHYAARNADSSVLKYWITHSDLAVDKKSHQNETPLLEAAKAGLPQNAALLIEYGADPSVKTYSGTSPVSVASQKRQDSQLLKMMLPYVDDVNITNSDTNTLLINAINARNYETAQMLVNAGADVNLPNHAGITPLIAAVDVKDIPLMTLCLSNGARVNMPDKYGSTPVLRAAAADDATLVEVLHIYGANVEHEDKFGYTPLLEAALSGSPSTIQLLLDLGASPYRLNADGKTPEQLYREKTGKELKAHFERLDIKMPPKPKNYYGAQDRGDLPDYTDKNNRLNTNALEQEVPLNPPVGPKSLKEFLTRFEQDDYIPSNAVPARSSAQNKALINHLDEMKTARVSTSDNPPQEALSDNAVNIHR